MLNETQTVIFNILKSDPALSDVVIPILNPSDFDYFPVHFCIEKLIYFYSRYKVLPPNSYYQEEAKRIKPPLTNSELLLISDLFNAPISPALEMSGREFIEKYLKQKRLSKLIGNINEHLEQNELDESIELVKQFSSEQSTLFDKRLGEYLFSGFPDRLRKYMLQDESEDRIPTLLEPLDRVLEGGLGRKELTVLLGSPGKGKSSFCCYMAKVSALLGIPALYVSLEMSEELIAKRIEASLTGVPMNSFLSAPDILKKRISKYGKFCSEVLIKQFPSGTVGVDVLHSYVKQVMREFPFKLLIVDYGDLLQPDALHRRSERRFELENVFTRLRGIAVEENIAVLAPSQANREALKSNVIRMEHTSESISKMFVSDVVLSLNLDEPINLPAQVEEPVYTDEAGDASNLIDKTKDVVYKGTIFIVKNRRQRMELQIPFIVNFSTMTFKEYKG